MSGNAFVCQQLFFGMVVIGEILFVGDDGMDPSVTQGADFQAQMAHHFFPMSEDVAFPTVDLLGDEVMEGELSGSSAQLASLGRMRNHEYLATAR